jgi:hypothetical protein
VLFRTGRETQDLAGEWTGSLVVASGQEDEVLVAVGNQSALDVSFEGRLEDR